MEEGNILILFRFRMENFSVRLNSSNSITYTSHRYIYTSFVVQYCSIIQLTKSSYILRYFLVSPWSNKLHWQTKCFVCTQPMRADITVWCCLSSDGLIHKMIPTFMMTPSNGNIFRVDGPLCGELTGHRWIPRTKASDGEPWCFHWSAHGWLSKQSWGWWSETPSCSLWR